MFRIQGIGIALSIMLTGFSSNAEAGKVLPIPPKLQSTPSWCWLATGEMVFKYYKIAQNHPTDFQCGEARFQGAVQVGIGGPMSFWGPCWVNCNNCRSASAGSVQGLINMINQYPPAMKIINGSGVVLQAPQVSLTALDFDDIQSEIENDRPIIAGISPGAATMPPGLAEHAVLIVGYNNPGEILIVNDPFPYQQANMMPPYIQFGGTRMQLGRFAISYAAMVNSLNWSNAVYDISP